MNRYNTVGKHKTSVTTFEDTLAIKYYNTNVVMVLSTGNILLDTGGHKTNTTKLRMNQASGQYNLGFMVSQRKGKWYVTTNKGEIEYTGNTFIIKKEE